MPLEAVSNAVAEAIAETGYQSPEPGGYTDTPPPTAEPDPASVATPEERIAALQAQVDVSAPLLKDLEAVRANPQQAVRALADVVGLRVEEPDQGLARRRAVLTGAYNKLAETIGPEGAEVLAPIVGEVLADLANTTFGPIKDAIALREAEAERQAGNEVILTTITNFKDACAEAGAEFSPEIENEMAELAKSGAVLPGPNATPASFLNTLYTQVMHTRNARRARDAAARPELYASIRPGMGRGRVRARVTPDMSEEEVERAHYQADDANLTNARQAERDAVRAAVAQATRDVAAGRYPRQRGRGGR